MRSDAAGNDLDRAEFTKRSGEAEHHTISRPHLMAGSVMRAKVCRPKAPRLRSLLLLGSDLLQHRNTSRMTSGRLTKAVAMMIAGGA